MNTKRKIFVGVSGGVDSSVAAFLLKKEGHEVHGVYIKPWSPEWLPCTWVDEKRDAMRVCATLDIPFHFLDGEEAYKQGVAEYMIAEYRAGRTPNPDVLCNRVIKFGLMWDYAKSNGADAIATGHYARTDGYALRKGIDDAKDQSYFLWMLKKDELAHVKFPIGGLEKSRVRDIAASVGLLTADKKDSQGICFLGEVDLREFLLHYIDQKKGEVIDEHGLVIGEHDGVWFYTLGERHGFRITVTDSDAKPQYIIGKHIEKNQLIVSTTPTTVVSNNSTLTIRLREENWLAAPQSDDRCTVQLRYHGECIPATVINEKTIVIQYKGVVPLGQSLVVYSDEQLMGGGIIDSVE